VFGRAENVLTLPAEAVKSIGDRRYVLIAENGQLRRAFVETGIETDGVVEIRSGVEEGMEISAR
jgi:multidrug efflux pump subunit AcrA (membrane-fusion protein)